jgi:hypothetical protein
VSVVIRARDEGELTGHYSLVTGLLELWKQAKKLQSVLKYGMEEQTEKISLQLCS